MECFGGHAHFDDLTSAGKARDDSYLTFGHAERFGNNSDQFFVRLAVNRRRRDLHAHRFAVEAHDGGAPGRGMNSH